MKIVFVCHGNICRSPMAEFVMKDLLAKAHRADVEVESRATSREEIWGDVGNPIYPPAARCMRCHGVPYSAAKRAEQLSHSDVATADLVVVMDDNNVRNTLRLCPEAAPNTRKLLDYCGGGNVADPWYTDDFETAYRDIVRGCRALLATI